MKTIIQVVQHLRPGGFENLVLDLLSFSAIDEKNIIISLEGSLEGALKEWPKLIPYREQLIFVNKQPGISPLLLLTLQRIFKKHTPYAVHTHHIGPLLYAGLAARLTGIKKLIHTEHDAWHLNDKKRCLIQRNAIKLLQPTLVADAKTIADNMYKKLKYKHKINVIYNGINTDYFIPGNKTKARAQLNLPKDALIIGCSGRMEKVKGQSILISALANLPDSVHLVFAGSGSCEANLRHLSHQLGLTRRIHFLGYLDVMPTFYQALDFFCLPSLNEGFPLSSLEAQSCNIKTLVTDVGASKETLCPQSGVFIRPNNPLLMAHTLLSMLKSSNKELNKVQPRGFIQQYANIHHMAQSYANLRLSTHIKKTYIRSI